MKKMTFKLDYGRTGLEVSLPAERVVGPLAIRDVPPLPDPEAAVAAALGDPIGTPAAPPDAQGRKDACILICDITRPVPNQTILRPMLEVSERRPVSLASRHLILVATGLHRPSTDAEKLEMLGEEIVAGYPSRRPLRHRLEEHTLVGTTSRGFPAGSTAVMSGRT